MAQVYAQWRQGLAELEYRPGESPWRKPAQTAR